jgi:hypothetical protein
MLEKLLPFSEFGRVSQVAECKEHNLCTKQKQPIPEGVGYFLFLAQLLI